MKSLILRFGTSHRRRLHGQRFLQKVGGMLDFSQMEATKKQLRLAGFWRKYLRLTRGRVGVLRALEIMAEEEADKDFQCVMREIHNDLQEGLLFREAIEKHPTEFSLSVREIVKVAEKSGAWDEVIPEIVAGLEEGVFG